MMNKITEIASEIASEIVGKEIEDEVPEDEVPEDEVQDNHETDEDKTNDEDEKISVEETPPLMTPAEMQTFLIEFYGIPIALRKQGDKKIICPYCKEIHIHSLMDRGYVTALCENRDKSITVNDRIFTPNYGITIYEYASTKDNTCFKIIEPL